MKMLKEIVIDYLLVVHHEVRNKAGLTKITYAIKHSTIPNKAASAKKIQQFLALLLTLMPELKQPELLIKLLPLCNYCLRLDTKSHLSKSKRKTLNP